MIDFLDNNHQQQQQHPQAQYWLQQHQPPRGPPGSHAGLMSNGQVIQQQAALHHHHQQQPQPTYQKQQTSLVELQQPSSDQLQQGVNGVQNNSANNELIGYYFGSISRETAEWILKNHGAQLDGAYLLRSSGPKDDFVLSLMVVHEVGEQANTINEVNHQQQVMAASSNGTLSGRQAHLEVLHYKIVETEDSFVALHGQVGDEKFATIDELIERAQGVATKPKWPVQRQSLESQILPPTFWGLTVDQVRLAILIKAKQWGFPLSIFQQPSAHQSSAYTAAESCQGQQSKYVINGGQLSTATTAESLNGDSVSQVNLGAANNSNNLQTTTLNNETIRTLIYKSLHEFQPWFHGRISREEAERRIELAGGDGQSSARDGRFLVRERDNFSYAMCIAHKRTTKHYRIDVLPTGELAIQDGRKFTSLMALVSHYTIMSDGLWCALTEPCPRPIQQQQQQQQQQQARFLSQQRDTSNNIYCVPPPALGQGGPPQHRALAAAASHQDNTNQSSVHASSVSRHQHNANCKQQQQSGALICPNQSAAVLSIRAPPIKEWLHSINHKWSQLMAARSHHQGSQSLNSFLFGSSNPLNNHCRHRGHHNHSHRHHNNNNNNNNHHHRRRCTKSNCAKHQQQQQHEPSNVCHQRHKTPPSVAGINGQSTTMTRQSGAYGDCCCGSVGGGAHSVAGSYSQTMIQNRMQPPAATGRSAISAAGSLKSAPPTNLIRQYIGTGAGTNCTNSNSNGPNGGSDQLVTGAMPLQQQQQQQPADYTRALLSCLPQTPHNSGFTLDSQSFIGSPLFAVVVKTHSNSQAPASATIDGFNAAARNGNRASGGGGGVNGTGGASYGASGRSVGSTGSSGGGGGCAASNNLAAGEEKLISPAQSVSANLNNSHHRAANPYTAGAADIYGGSQTSTALVNDQNSSSSPSTGASQPGARPPASSVADLKQQRAQPQSCQMATLPQLAQSSTARYGTQPAPGAISHFGANQPLVSLAGQPVPGRLVNVAPHPQQLQYCTQQPQQQQLPVVQHTAGPIFCGQHAGPAYRYTNCTGDQSQARPCYHSRTLAAGPAPAAGPPPRALDDSQLMTATSQLGGPAALTKFVQFQDGQCLRTHRDTRSIQMAYLLSRQEALNVLNSRSATMTRPPAAAATARLHNHTGTQNGHNHYQQQQQNFIAYGHQQQQQQQQNNQIRGFTSTQNGGSAVGCNGWPAQQAGGRPVQHANNVTAAAAQMQQQQQQQQEQADFDLMDCDDGEGGDFQFKYDPKLIKSSSIETLCGAGTGGGGANDQEERDQWLSEELANFKSHSELLMSLKSCWPSYGGVSEQQQEPALDILSPIIAASHHQTAENNERSLADGLASLMNDVAGEDLTGAAPSTFHIATSGSGDLDESVRRKHDLDELTTSLLAELTASLKAQVDLKNKRSGLCNMQQQQQADDARQTSHQNGQNDRAHSPTANGGGGEQANPRELINEFDTLLVAPNK